MSNKPKDVVGKFVYVTPSVDISDQPADRLPASTAKVDTVLGGDPKFATHPKSAIGAMTASGLLGRYRMLGELGRGGMGAVFLAEDTILKRKVALKIPQFEPDKAEQMQARFLREAQIAAQLSHPNICRVYDVEVIDGQYVMAMEYLEGKTLAEFAKAGKLLKERQSVQLIKKIALAIEAAHQKGLIHRDLKPSNIMLPKPDPSRKSIEPKVMDFGLAKSFDSKATDLTKSGMIVGTPCYMSKEQWSGKEAQLGPQCDVYSLGVILYELLTGKLPYDVDEYEPATSWFVKLLTHPPIRPSERKPDIDAALEPIVMRAIAAEAKDRYPTMADFAADLNAWLKGKPTTGQTLMGIELGSFGSIISPTTKGYGNRRRGAIPSWFLWGGLGSAAVLFFGAMFWFSHKSDGKGKTNSEVGFETTGSLLAKPDRPVVQEAADFRSIVPTTKVSHEQTTMDLENSAVAEDRIPIGKQTGTELLTRDDANEDMKNEREIAPPHESQLDRQVSIVRGNGKWEIDGNELSVSECTRGKDNGEQFLTFGDQRWTDYDFSAECRHEGSATGVSLIFRSPNDKQLHLFGYGWLNRQTCLLEHWSPSRSFENLNSDDDLLTVQTSEPIVSDHWYFLKVSVRGSRVQAFRDGELLLESSHCRYGAGRVGFRTWRIWPGRTRFRKILVTTPDGKILWRGVPVLDTESTSLVPINSQLLVSPPTKSDGQSEQEVADVKKPRSLKIDSTSSTPKAVDSSSIKTNKAQKEKKDKHDPFALNSKWTGHLLVGDTARIQSASAIITRRTAMTFTIRVTVIHWKDKLPFVWEYECQQVNNSYNVVTATLGKNSWGDEPGAKEFAASPIILNGNSIEIEVARPLGGGKLRTQKYTLRAQN